MFNETVLGEVLNFYNGKAIKPGGEGKYPAYGSNGIIGGCDDHRYEDGIIIGRVGAYCGSVAYCRGRFWASDNTIVVKPKQSGGSTRFFAYMLLAMNLNRHAGGAAQPLVTQSTLKAIPAAVPDPTTQARIASILSSYDDLVENNTRRIAILKDMAQRIYDEWFVRFRFPGYQGVRMVVSELGMVPESWQVVRLKDVLVLQRGFDLPKQDRTDGAFPIISATGANASHHEYKVKGPGVVTGRSGSLGTVMFVEGDFWPLNTTLWVKQFAVGSPLYAYYVLKAIDLKGFNSGAAVPTLNRNDVHGLPVVRPTPDVLTTFDEVVGPMIRLKRRLELLNENLRATRDFLLPKLLSGELDVSVLCELEALAA